MKRELDIATLAGIVSGVILIIVAMLIGGGVGMFINIPSMLIVVGGTAAATKVNFPLKEVLSVMKFAMKTLFSIQESPVVIMKQIIEFAGVVKRDGELGLEKVVNDVKNPFLKTALGYIFDGAQAEELNSCLKLHLIEMRARHKVGIDISILRAASQIVVPSGTVTSRSSMLRVTLMSGSRAKISTESARGR